MEDSSRSVPIEKHDYIDQIRAFAIIAVVVLHVVAMRWKDVPYNSFDWMVFNFYEAIVRWGVPCFVMISGALYLSKPVNPTKLKRNICSLLFIYFIWSTVYSLVYNIAFAVLGRNNSISVSNILRDIILGHTHMWFIPMIVGLYVTIPILKKLTESRAVMKYFLVLWLTFSIILPTCISVFSHFGNGIFGEITDIMDSFIGMFRLDIFGTYIGYFVLGYYLHVTKINKAFQKGLICMLVGVFATVLISSIGSIVSMHATDIFYEANIISNFLVAMGVYLCNKQRTINNLWIKNFIKKISDKSFGIYLIHVLFIGVLGALGLDTLVVHPIVAVPIISAFVVMISYFTVLIIGKIPIICKILYK